MTIIFHQKVQSKVAPTQPDDIVRLYDLGTGGGGGTQGPQGPQGPSGITTIGGDLSGPPNNAIVWRLRGVEQIADVRPAFKQVLTWNGDHWIPMDLPTLPIGTVLWDGGLTVWTGPVGEAVTWS
ncbi:MAG: hypothetical protein C5B54_01920 [Acidobacteria bacterium]|nr:MAG: hypothetical protein C5B54_01920 [Acidobacteriota bacterium]